MPNCLHIVSFNVPYPPDYGGVIDVYYKLKALYELGVKIILHTFHYGRDPSSELDAICEKVYYYPRRSAMESLSIKWPVVIKSRRSSELLDNLAADDYPILFEGLHTCFYLGNEAIAKKRKIVRLHNVEWDYYFGLSQAADNWLKSFYLRWESAGLRAMESVLKHADLLCAISPKDTTYFQTHFPKVEYLPAFHSNQAVTSKTGTGDFLLYQGNLSIPENIKAVRFLIREVLHGLSYHITIAGKDPPESLVKLVEENEHITLISNPDTGLMNRLIEEAHIHLMPTFQSTGIKLKLLNALFKGRHVIVNQAMIQDTELASACIVSEEPTQFRQLIQAYMDKPFTDADVEQRKRVLLPQFDNLENAKGLIKWIFDEGVSADRATHTAPPDEELE